MEVKVTPLEYDLEQVVQHGDAAIAAHVQTPPNRRELMIWTKITCRRGLSPRFFPVSCWGQGNQDIYSDDTIAHYPKGVLR